MRTSTQRAITVQLLVVVLASVLFLAAACGREEITHARVKKAPETSAGQMSPTAMAREKVPAPPAPSNGGELQWTLPKGWTETAGSGMRYATLKPAVPGRIDVSVIVLPGPAGGELANVNRWRGQIGLGPIDEQALATARTALETRAGTFSVYDFSSEGDNKSRLVAGLGVVEGSTWFVKMLGDAGPVAAARTDFTRFLQSLRRDAAN